MQETTANKIIIEANVVEVGDVADMGAAGVILGTSTEVDDQIVTALGTILTGRAALIVARWIRPYQRVRVIIEPAT